MKITRLISAFVSLSILLAFPSVLWAADFAITCCDANDIKSALETAQSNGENDTITIAPGTYDLAASNQSVVLSYTASSSSVENYSLTINAGGGQVILDGGSSVQILSITAYVGGENTAAAHVAIDGITFRNGDIDSTSFTGGGLFVRTLGANITISDCTFSGNSATGFFQDPNAGGAFLRAGTGTITLTNSVFRDNEADILGGGAYIYGDTGGTVIITNNTFTGNQSNSSTIGGGGLYLKVWGTTQIYNNIVWGNTAATGGDIYLAKSTSTANLYNNDFSDLDYDDATNLTQSGNINQDPVLTSDSHIGEGSPCIDAGSSGAPSLPTQDFEGGSRTVGSAPDIGADEYYVAVSIPTLSEFGTLVLMTLMALVAIRHVKIAGI